MEKPVKQRSKILAFLPKAASAVTVNFHISPPISPVGKGLSGPIVSLIPKEAPRKSKNGSFDAREPASPEVSCMGQIKCKKKKKVTVSKPKLASPPPQAFPEQVKIRKSFVMLKVLKGTKRDHNKSDVSNAEADQVAEKVPSLRQMKQFSSARGTLSDFDWMANYDAAGGACNVSNPLYEEKGMKSEKEAKIVVNGVGKRNKKRKFVEPPHV
ncbi:hypothetical protein REPUB_Repub10bG0182000 [Reevesia pubescens]